MTLWVKAAHEASLFVIFAVPHFTVNPEQLQPLPEARSSWSTVVRHTSEINNVTHMYITIELSVSYSYGFIRIRATSSDSSSNSQYRTGEPSFLELRGTRANFSSLTSQFSRLLLSRDTSTSSPLIPSFHIPSRFLSIFLSFSVVSYLPVSHNVSRFGRIPTF